MTRLIAGFLWAAHFTLDPDYTSTPGLSTDDSRAVADTLFRIHYYPEGMPEINAALTEAETELAPNG